MIHEKQISVMSIRARGDKTVRLLFQRGGGTYVSAGLMKAGKDVTVVLDCSLHSDKQTNSKALRVRHL